MPSSALLKRLTEDQEQRSAIQCAFYNTIFFLLIALCGAGLYVSYEIFQLFLTPILWATLVGTVIFPMKRSVSCVLSSWFEQLDETDTPLVVGCITLPIKGTNAVAQFIYDQLLSSFGIYYIAAYVVLKLLSYEGVLVNLLALLGKVYSFSDVALSIATQNWVAPVMLLYTSAYIAWVFVTDSETVKRQKKFARILSLPVWLFSIAYTSSYCGMLRVLVFSFSTAMLALISLGVIGSRRIDAIILSEEKLDSQELVGDASNNEDANFVEGAAKEMEVTKKDANALATAQVLTASEALKTYGNNYVRAVVLLSVILLIAKHDWLLICILALFLIAASANAGVRLGLYHKTRALIVRALFSDESKKLINVSVPGALRKFIYILFTSDKFLIGTLKLRVPFLSSIAVMLALALSSLLAMILAALYLQSETVHVVHLTGNLVSSNQGWLKSAVNFTEEQLTEHHIDDYVEEAYKQSRVWLAYNIRSLADPKDSKRADQLEAQAKTLIDQMYALWEDRNITIAASNASATALSTKSDWLGQLTSASNLESLSKEFLTVIQSNIDTVLSVSDVDGVSWHQLLRYTAPFQIAQSAWRILSLNISIVTTVLAFVLSFGFELINVLLETVVFLTVLYYLLANSLELWLPLRWISDVTRSLQQADAEDTVASAIESAISSVFVLSAKMSCFYGFYTYIVSTLFSLQVVFIPSMLAALLACVPVIPPYSVAVLGIIELYVVRSAVTATVVFALASVAPLFFADAAFYSEVKNCHPYFTGLAIIGGLYYSGFQGAFLGPLALCCFIIVLNIYADFARNS